MRFLLAALLLSLSLFAQKQPNGLINEESPYLQQHAYNPVDWLPWGEEAFALSKEKHKPIFLSIGYSTCHWCHVMLEESFEDERIAELINRYFIPVKIDREEMPHLDSHYQQLFLKLKKRSGGWPLTVLLSEERKPFYITTYIPPSAAYGVEGLDTLLPELGSDYQKQPELIARRVNAIEAIIQTKHAPLDPDKAKITTKTLFNAFEKMYDDLYIGFSISPKFPEASKIALLFDLGKLGDDDAQKMGLEVLRTMALRGLYDHVEGGFFRYSTDAAWEVPHFEKMLYNQAELIPLYVKAFHLTGEVLFRDVVKETIAMTEEHFGREGLFLSASDADSDHQEGGYFIYTNEQLKGAIAQNSHAKELDEAIELYEKGNFEGKQHLNFYTEQRPQGFASLQKALKELRKGRTYPFIDNKVITAWNAMMVEALYAASSIDPLYVKKADDALGSLLKTMFANGHLYHQSLYGKKPFQAGLLEDYAFVISTLLKAFETTYEKKHLLLAKELTEKALTLFYKDGTWVQNSEGMPVSVDLRDKYYTSSFGRMMQDLYKLASLKEAPKYAAIATASLKLHLRELEERQADVPSTAIAYLMQQYGVVVLKHSSKTLQEKRQAISTIRFPYLLSKPDKSGLYLACTIGACFAYDKKFTVIKEQIEALSKR